MLEAMTEEGVREGKEIASDDVGENALREGKETMTRE